MRKLILIIGLSSISALSFATNLAESADIPANHAFQEFDNQFYIGFGGSYGSLKNAYGQSTNYGTTQIGIGIERLFDMGIWLAFDGTLMTGYSNYNSTNPNALTGPLGQAPGIGNLDLKVGYAFPLLPNALLVTPYVLLGRNTNLTSNAINNNMGSKNGVSVLSANVTQDYFLTSGLGGRLEYRVNRVVDVYFDQNALYNSDSSAPNSNYNPASNFQFTSTIGAKFNVWDELQLGLNGFYTYNQLSGAASQAQQFELYPVNQVGGMITVGMTY